MMLNERVSAEILSWSVADRRAYAGVLLDITARDENHFYVTLYYKGEKIGESFIHNREYFKHGYTQAMIKWYIKKFEDMIKQNPNNITAFERLEKAKKMVSQEEINEVLKEVIKEYKKK